MVDNVTASGSTPGQNGAPDAAQQKAFDDALKASGSQTPPPPPQTAPPKPSAADQAAVKEAGTAATKDYATAANDPGQREAFATAISGKSAQERTAFENAGYNTLFDNIARQRFETPRFEAAAVAQDPASIQALGTTQTGQNEYVLPSSIQGAYAAAGTGTHGSYAVTGSGGGVALIAGNLRGDQLASTAREEYGEAIAANAKALGLEAAPGDVGDRLEKTLAGQIITPSKTPEAFIDKTGSNDNFQARVDGVVTQVKGAVVAPPPITLKSGAILDLSVNTNSIVLVNLSVYNPEISNTRNSIFFDNIKNAPDGSDANILYNLYKAKSLGNTPGLFFHVKKTDVNTDIVDYIAKPGIQTMLREATEQAVPRVLPGQTAEGFAIQAAQYLFGSLPGQPATSTYPGRAPLSQESTTATLNHIALLSPEVAEQTAKAITQWQLNVTDQRNATSLLGSATPQAQLKAVQTVFQIAVSDARFGVGALGKASSAMSGFSKNQLEQAAQAAATYIKDNKDNWFTSIGTVGSNAFVGADPIVANGVQKFFTGLAGSGALGSLSGVLAGIAVVQDFTTKSTTAQGGNTADGINSPWGIVNTTADVMNVVGATGDFYNLGKTFTGYLKQLGLDRETQANLKTITELASRANNASEGSVTGAIELVTISDKAAVKTALSSSSEISLTAPEIESLATSISETATAGGYSTVAELRLINGAGYSGVTNPMATGAYDINVFNPIYNETPIFEEGTSQLAALVEEEITAAPLTAEAIATSIITVGETLPGSAASLGGVVSALAPEGATIGAASSVTLSNAFKGLGLLGSLANFFYGAKNIKSAVDAFHEHDFTGGALSSVSAGGLILSGTAGTAGFVADIALAEAAAAAVVPGLQVAAAVLGVVGFGASLANYLVHRHNPTDPIGDAIAFLKTGVGTGESYYK